MTMDAVESPASTTGSAASDAAPPPTTLPQRAGATVETTPLATPQGTTCYTSACENGEALSACVGERTKRQRKRRMKSKARSHKGQPLHDAKRIRQSLEVAALRRFNYLR